MSERERNHFVTEGRRLRQGAAWTPITRVRALLLGNRDQLLARYVSPAWVQWFTLTEAWFNETGPYTKIGLLPTPVNPKAAENTLKVFGERAIFLKEVRIVTTTVPGAPVLFVGLERLGSRNSETKAIKPKSRGGMLEYQVAIGGNDVAKSVTFRFDIRDQKAFRWVSANIVGFVC
jgi:hypothetical protein